MARIHPFVGHANSEGNGSARIGTQNTAVWYQALTNNTTGATAADQGRSNSALGHSALTANTTGSFNVATGANNTAIGYRAGFSATTGANNIYLGDAVAGMAGEANTIRVGNLGTQTKTVIAGVRGFTTVNANAIPVMIDSVGQLGTASSSRRVKRNIRSMGEASQVLQVLRPVSFEYTAHPVGGPLQYGLIAEEVAEVAPDLVVHNAGGQFETVAYHKVNAMLLNEVQRLSRGNQEQEQQIDIQQSQIEALLARLTVVEQRLVTTRPNDLDG